MRIFLKRSGYCLAHLSLLKMKKLFLIFHSFFSILLILSCESNLEVDHLSKSSQLVEADHFPLSLNIDTTQTMETLDTFFTDGIYNASSVFWYTKDECCAEEHNDSLYEAGAKQVMSIELEKKSNPGSYCCDVQFQGYGYPPFPGTPPLIIFKTEGYTIEGATGYFMHWKLFKKIGTNNWVVVWENDNWLDFEKQCDGQIYGIGLAINLGECPGKYKVFLAKGHYNSDGSKEYCVGDTGYFYYPGYPLICSDM